MTKVNDYALLDMDRFELIELIWTLSDEDKAKGPSRKDQVYKYLLANQPCSIADIAEGLDINARNVSSQLTYLRKDGLAIATNSQGMKFIETTD